MAATDLISIFQNISINWKSEFENPNQRPRIGNSNQTKEFGIMEIRVYMGFESLHVNPLKHTNIFQPNMY